MAKADAWCCWFNGAIVPEREARVPFRDRGFLYGDAVFDTTRTFGHRIFKLAEHIARLYRSLAYLRIDPGLSPEKMADISEEVTARNLKLIGKDEDFWVTQRVSRGLDEHARETWPGYPSPSVIVECRMLPFRQRARFFRDGVDVVTPSVRRTPPDSISPRAKTDNYLNLILGQLEVEGANPDAIPVLLDTHGNLAEGRGNNVFVVRDGAVYTPREQFVLPGISRRTVMDLADGLGIPVVEKDLDLYDATTADEAFLTSTSWCICPVRAVNGARVGARANGAVPGPVTKKLIDAYVQLVGFDWYGQYLRYVNR
jgi:branched-chain amino acid aminotransferase